MGRQGAKVTSALALNLMHAIKCASFRNLAAHTILKRRISESMAIHRGSTGEYSDIITKTSHIANTT